MVMCAMGPLLIPHPPPLNLLLLKTTDHDKANIHNSPHSSGFRLLDSQSSPNDDNGSICSIYKQKIDSMFSESDSSSNAKNFVQARIEKMFTEVAKDGGIPPINNEATSSHKFAVDYLGSVALQEKVTSLIGLQRPLKDLYFAYKRISRVKKMLTGCLEISGVGLKVMYQGEKGDLEQLNSFPTIAVWSAVKFVLRESSKDVSGSSYAFLPLITDPDNIEKKNLFTPLDPIDQKYIKSEQLEYNHSPLFAVVMRKMGLHKQLECHGFVCQTSEDAIVIAATLYKSLMTHMKAKEKRPRNRNGITSCLSLASSRNSGYNDVDLVPVRPPRKKRSSSSSVISDVETIEMESSPLIKSVLQRTPKKSTKAHRAPRVPDKPVRQKSSTEDLDAILSFEEHSSRITQETVKPPPRPLLGDKWNTFKSNNQKQITEEIKQMMSGGGNMGLKRIKSLRRRNEELQCNENVGDILTKITIPRSGSFLNTTGLTRYKTKVQRANGQATGGSPLGFSELFNEFRLQEGLHSLDEILGVIIDSEGMSFNDLKPIYKEFLLKLSVTLTKDELYQRSKSIMRRQKKKVLRRPTSSYQTRKSSVIVFSKFKRLKHVFQKLKPRKRVKTNDINIERNICKIPESTISSASYDTQQFIPKEDLHRKQSYKKRGGNNPKHSGSRRERHSTSEDSDFFSLRATRNNIKHLAHINHNKNSSSGYVSCSECSFDSENCTCKSADKCYCSMGHKNMRKISPNQCDKPCKDEDDKCYCDLDKTDLLTFCECDTDSCADSNKCYCPSVEPDTNLLGQLKRSGFMPSTESTFTSSVGHKNYANTRSSRSLEYTSKPVEYYNNPKPPKTSKSFFGGKRSSSSEKTKAKGLNPAHLSLDYDMSYELQRKAKYSESIKYSGPNCCDGSYRRCKSVCSDIDVLNENTSSGKRNSDTDLNQKKSDEIAALFADIRRCQLKNITRQRPRSPSNLISYPASRQISNPVLVSSTKNLKQLPYASKIVTNTLYNAKVGPQTDITNDGMFSAKNGLYTIHSDDSRDSKKNNINANDFNKDFAKNRITSNGIGNSLGYLP